MSVNLSPLGGAGAQFFTNDGVPLTGGLLYTYLAGTSTPATTYTSSNGLTALANPIILDAAGRVPTGEIWLTDGISYKFVLKDSTDVLIATWDGLSGINSNFIAYTALEETATATANQTVFNLTLNYVPATNNLAVFVNGSNQIVNVNYTETDDNTVTFLTGLNVGDVVKFSTATPVATNAMDAANVSYTPAGATAVVTNVQAKLREYVSVQDFGAVGDGVADDTDAIINAVATGKTVYLPVGTYLFKDDLTLADANIIGESKTTSILLAGTKPSPSTYGCFAIIATGQVSLSNFTFKNQTWISGTTPGGSNAITILDASDFVIDNLIVENVDSWALTPQNSTNGVVSNCIVRNTNSDGIHLTGCQQVSVVNNVVYNTRDDAISLTSEDAGPLAAYQDQFGISVIGNNITSSSQGRGIAVDGGNTYNISNNTIIHNSQNSQAAIGIASATAYLTRATYNISVTGNNIRQITGFTGPAQQCMWLTGAVRDINISNNIFGGTVTGILINLQDNNTAPNQDISINGNTFIGMTTAITTSFADDVYNISINDNAFVDGTDTQINLLAGFNNAIIVGNRFDALPVNAFVYQIATTGTTSDRLLLASNTLVSGNAQTTKISVGVCNLTLGDNRVNVLAIDTSAIRNKNSGVFIGSGTGAQTQFTVPHYLSTTPSSFNVTIASLAAQIPYYVTVSSTLILVNFNSAPASGTNNVSFSWSAQI